MSGECGEVLGEIWKSVEGGEVGYSPRAGQNPFTGQTRPAGRMLPMPGLEQQNRSEKRQILGGFCHPGFGRTARGD